jgi:amino acid adenylation domain-containing protein
MTVDSGPWHDCCIHRHFEAQVGRTPSAPAVLFEGADLSYVELNRRANRLARRLMALGVGPEVPVGVYMVRSLELAVAVLACHKAGGVCVPLDPDLPRERLEFIIEDARVEIALTQMQPPAWLAESGRSLVAVAIGGEDDASECDKNPDSGVTGDNLSIIFYTSGSTGTPNAVMSPHRASCSRLLWAQAHGSPIGPGDRTVLCTSIGFGSFLGEFGWPLMTGATLVLAPPGGYGHIDSMIHLLVENRITLVCLVPSVLGLIVRSMEEGEVDALGEVRHILSHGEALSVDLQRRAVGLGRAELHKYYGLTECPGATYWNCTRGGTPEVLTIGRPTDVHVYILDEDLRPVLPGEAGEIYLSGPSLTRGYLNRPGLTAQRYLPNPFDGVPGSRMFKTGDRGRWLADGTIEFLGRADQQVKILGVRIELGEIEAALSAHAAVREAILSVAMTPGGFRALVAHVVPEVGHAPSSDELRAYLRKFLPSSAIPAHYEFRDQLPRLLNGKVDRHVLALSARMRVDSAEVDSQPPTELEQELSRIWAKVLDVKKVMIHDDFFELGGNSLLVTRLCEQIRQVFGRTISPTAILAAPTVAEMASLLVCGNADARDGDAPRSEIERPILFALGKGLDLAREIRDQPVHGLAEITWDDWRNYDTIEACAARLVAEVRRVQPDGPYLLSGYSAFTLVVFEMARQLHQAGHEVALVVLYEAVRIPLIKPDDRPRRTAGPAAVVTPAAEGPRPVPGRRRLLGKIRSARSKIMIRLHRIMLRIPLLARFRSIPPWLRVVHAGWSYRPEPFDGRVVIYASTMTRDRFGGEAYGAAWEKLADQDLKISLFDGVHSCMFEGRQRAEMIRDLEQELVRAVVDCPVESGQFASRAGSVSSR